MQAKTEGSADNPIGMKKRKASTLSDIAASSSSSLPSTSSASSSISGIPPSTYVPPTSKAKAYVKASSCIIPKASLSSEVSSSVSSFQRCTRPRNWESSEQQQQQHVGQYTDDDTPCKKLLLFQPDGSRATFWNGAFRKPFFSDWCPSQKRLPIVSATR